VDTPTSSTSEHACPPSPVVVLVYRGPTLWPPSAQRPAPSRSGVSPDLLGRWLRASRVPPPLALRDSQFLHWVAPWVSLRHASRSERARANAITCLAEVATLSGRHSPFEVVPSLCNFRNGTLTPWIVKLLASIRDLFLRVIFWRADTVAHLDKKFCWRVWVALHYGKALLLRPISCHVARCMRWWRMMPTCTVFVALVFSNYVTGWHRMFFFLSFFELPSCWLLQLFVLKLRPFWSSVSILT